MIGFGQYTGQDEYEAESEQCIIKERTPSPMYNLPNELIYEVLNKINTADLLSVRTTSSYLSSVANLILASRMNKDILMYKLDLVKSKAHMIELEETLRPHLTHYRQFLSNLNTTEVSEVAWYKTCPTELHTVSTCLVLLKNGGLTQEDPSIPSHGQSISWPSVKKQLNRRDFKDWFTSLSTTVDAISYTGVKQVEAIIQRDQDITYERLREVSEPGYRLLIVVAAVLQYANLSEAIRSEERTMGGLSKGLVRSEVFVGFCARLAVGCDLPFLPVQQEIEKGV